MLASNQLESEAEGVENRRKKVARRIDGSDDSGDSVMEVEPPATPVRQRDVVTPGRRKKKKSPARKKKVRQQK